MILKKFMNSIKPKIKVLKEFTKISEARSFVLLMYLLGFAFHSALNSLIQDLLGKDRYINVVQNYWVDSTISMPISIVCVGIITSIMIFFWRYAK